MGFIRYFPHTGIGGILVMGVGIFASGVFIRKAKPSPRAVAGWIALSALIYSMGMLFYVYFERDCQS